MSLGLLFCRASLQWARHSCYKNSLVYVRPSVYLSESVQTITSTIVGRFQNNLMQLFCIMCRCAFWNIRSVRPKVKVIWEGQIFVQTITPTILDGFQYKFAQLFSIMSRCAIWRFHLCRWKVKSSRLDELFLDILLVHWYMLKNCGKWTICMFLALCQFIWKRYYFLKKNIETLTQLFFLYWQEQLEREVLDLKMGRNQDDADQETGKYCLC